MSIYEVLKKSGLPYTTSVSAFRKCNDVEKFLKAKAKAEKKTRKLKLVLD